MAFQPVVIAGRARIIKTKAYRDFEDLVDAKLGPRKADLYDGPVKVVVRLFRPRRIGDIDGSLKALFDALNGRVWEDDAQIVELLVIRGDDKNNPRVELDVSEAEVVEVAPPKKAKPPCPQPSFFDFAGAK